MIMEVGTPPEYAKKPEQPNDGYQPPRMVYLGIALTILVFMVALVLLFAGGSSEPAKPASAEKLPFMEGTLVVVEQERLVLRPAKGGAEVTFAIRPQDVDNFDIAHLQSHSSVGIPTRLFYEKDGNALYAVYKEDAPVNAQE
jgi:hypothetical protein